MENRWKIFTGGLPPADVQTNYDSIKRSLCDRSRPYNKGYYWVNRTVETKCGAYIFLLKLIIEMRFYRERAHSCRHFHANSER